MHGTRESKISGGGGGFFRFSYFMYVTCCRFALRHLCLVLDGFSLRVAVDVFEVVVGHC